ncbi:MAG: hypothetical protein LBR83_00710 [Clostridiales bacterium]|nr:hypothetical protein [Clostridiales bacterium]
MKGKWFKVPALAFVFMLFFCQTVPASSRMTEAPYATYNVDKWGNAVPSPNGYLPARAVTGFENPRDLFYHAGKNEIYLVGTSGVWVLNEQAEIIRAIQFTLNGEPYAPAGLTGIYVTPGGDLYVCDFDGGAVIKSDSGGRIENIFGAPQSDLITRETNYRPSKIVVDSYGKMYVQAFGVFEGIYCLDADGSFINYYGANHVEMTLGRLALQAWKKIVTQEARRKMENFVPIEYSNLYIDETNFIYATVTTTADVTSGLTAQDIYRANNQQLLRKLNPLGVNVLPKTSMNWFQNAAFTDVTVDGDGVMTMCDAVLGVIYQCDKNGRLMFAFGGIGAQLGLFSRPSAIISVGDVLWVLDESKRSITLFSLTEFGRGVHDAMRLYNEGRYQEDISLWERVLRDDANYMLGYTGLGKAYYQLENYGQSLYYFKLAGDRQGYSDAFSEQSLIFMRGNFGWFFTAALLLALSPLMLKLWRRFRPKPERGGAKKETVLTRCVRELRFCLSCMKNPAAGFDAVKWSGKGSAPLGAAMVGLFFLTAVFNAQLTGFIFNASNPDKFSVVSVFMVTAGGFALVLAANYAVSSLLPSEATFRQLFITLAYSLAPYILCQLAVIAASNLVSAEMGVFLQFISVFGIGWSAVELMMGIFQTHRLGFKLVVANVALTAVGAAAILFFIFLLYSLFQQLYMFFYTIFSELMFRI